MKVNQIISELPQLNINKIHAKESTKVYDQNHRLIMELGVEKRDIVSYEDISQTMIHAVTSIEDEHFFEHNGIDVKRIFAAAVKNIKSQSYKEGASTVTQQLVKLSFLSNEKTIERKIKEIFISIELEERISKEKILEAYLNRVLFGGRIYGIEKASQHYFNKKAKDLTYEEAAMLAGMIQSPNRYDPYKNPELTKKRQMIVLNALFKNQFISKEELNNANKKPIDHLVVKHEKTNDNNPYYEYIDQVLYELANKYQLDPLQDSLKVVTYLDPNIQKKIYDTENNDIYHPNENTQTGIIVMETETGIIRGIGGGREHNGPLTFNFATNARRQPGSTIKPILDYAPAIEYLRYSPAQPYFDDKIYYQTLGSQYMRVNNYDNKYKGYLTMRESIIDSRNVTAIKAFREVGSKRAYEFVNKLGISTNEPITEAHAIGGYRHGFTVLQMAAAYAPFGNGGIYHEPTTIEYVIKDGEKISIDPVTKKAMRKDTAYLMSDILHSNMVTGTAKRANVSDLIIAGKTGQTNYSQEVRDKYNFPDNSVRDSWFIGYTTKYTTAVWLGYDKTEDGAYLTPTEAKKSLEIFKNVMHKIHVDRTESKPFAKPNNIIEVEIETKTYPLKLPNEYTPSMYRKKELFIRGTEPMEVSDFFKPLPQPKNFIVYYDDMIRSLVIKWDKATIDYSHKDFKLMEKVHNTENFYENYKHRTQKEYHEQENQFSPSLLTNNRINSSYENYCKSEKNNQDLCKHLENKSLQFYITLLEALKQYEISLLKEDTNFKVLSEGEISNIRGYKVWNGYRDGIFSRLGQIEYQIIGKNELNEILLYKGPYTDEIHLQMSFDQYLQFDAFLIKADYSKYTNKLQSDPNITLNPFFQIASLLKNHH